MEEHSFSWMLVFFVLVVLVILFLIPLTLRLFCLSRKPHTLCAVEVVVSQCPVILQAQLPPHVLVLLLLMIRSHPSPLADRSLAIFVARFVLLAMTGHLRLLSSTSYSLLSKVLLQNQGLVVSWIQLKLILLSFCLIFFRGPETQRNRYRAPLFSNVNSIYCMISNL